MTLRSILLRLEGNKDFVKKNFLGYYVYSFFINQIKKISFEKAENYHRKNTVKPFTLSPPFIYNDKIYIRACFLDEEIFSLFVSSLFEIKNIKLKEDFKLVKVYLIREQNLPKQIASFINIFSDEKKVDVPDFLNLKILTPLIFKKGNVYETIPNVDLIKNSFEKRQRQIYAKIIFSLPKFFIDEVDLKSKAVKIEPFGDFVGMVGKLKIKLIEKNSSFFALEFFGLGIKTTMGLGQIIVY